MPDRDIEIRVKAKEETAGVFAKVRAGLENLKQSAGKRSLLGESTETFLKGGGAVAGITLAAHELGEMAGEASRLREEFTQGKISLDEWDNGLIGMIPVLGTIWKAGREIRELWNGEKGEIDSARQADERLAESFRARNEYLRESLRLHEQESLAIEAMRGQTALIGQRGVGGDVGRSKESEKEAFASTGQTAIDKGEDVKAEASKKLDAIRKEKEDLKRNLASMDESSGLMTPATLAKYEEMKQRLAELNKQEQQTQHDSQDRVNKIYGDAKEKQKAIQEKGGKERKQIKEDDAFEAGQTAKAGEDRVTQIRGEASAVRLRESGKDLEAELAQLKATTDQKISEVQRAAEAEKRAHPDRAAKIDEQSKQELDAIRQRGQVQEDAARRADFNKKADKENEVEGTVNSAKLDTLRAEASLGSTAKQIELERAEIAEKYRQKREEIQKKLREDLTLTQQQKELLNQTLAGLGAQEDKEKRIAALKKSDIGLVHSNQDREVTGVALAFKAQMAAQKSALLKPAADTAPGEAGRGVAGAAAAFAKGEGTKQPPPPPPATTPATTMTPAASVTPPGYVSLFGQSSKGEQHPTPPATTTMTPAASVTPPGYVSLFGQSSKGEQHPTPPAAAKVEVSVTAPAATPVKPSGQLAPAPDRGPTSLFGPQPPRDKSKDHDEALKGFAQVLREKIQPGETSKREAHATDIRAEAEQQHADARRDRQLRHGRDGELAGDDQRRDRTPPLARPGVGAGAGAASSKTNGPDAAVEKTAANTEKSAALLAKLIEGQNTLSLAFKTLADALRVQPPTRPVF